MPKISLKEFMDRVEGKLQGLSLATLQAVIRTWAKQTPPNMREEFLANLNTSQGTFIDAEDLLAGIDDLMERVVSGSFCTGWGWDHEIHEERDFGDESWVEEVDEFFQDAQDALDNNQFDCARDAYQKLFEILEMGEEPGHLPGVCIDEMLETDLAEARASYLRAVYLAAPSASRPEAMWEGFNQFQSFYFPKDLNLTGVGNAGTTPLPGLDEFLPPWIALLEGKSDRLSETLLREAVQLQGGIGALAQVAGQRHPRAFLDWINALEQERNYSGMVDAVRKGLAEISPDLAIRAEIASALARAGEYLGDAAISLEGHREAFFSDPSLEHLAPLFSLANTMGSFAEEARAGIARVTALLEQREESAAPRYWGSENDQRPAKATTTLFCQISLLAGHFSEAIDACRDADSVDWTFPAAAKGQVISFLLRLLFRGESIDDAPRLNAVWRQATKVTSRGTPSSSHKPQLFDQVVGVVISSTALSGEEAENLLQWCVQESRSHVDQIVANQHRDLYSDAATLLGAIAEVLDSWGRSEEGASLFEEYRVKYPYHKSFQADLKKITSRWHASTSDF